MCLLYDVFMLVQNVFELNHDEITMHPKNKCFYDFAMLEHCYQHMHDFDVLET